MLKVEKNLLNINDLKNKFIECSKNEEFFNFKLL